MSDVRDVLDEALRLPLRDRADVAAELLSSLDEEDATMSAEEVERLWAAEITRRARRALRGESVGREADDVLDSIDQQLRQG